jgi:hypothetical protein
VQAGSSHAHVICLEAPWSHSAIRLHVTKGYDNSAMTTPARQPWGLTLARGRRCVLAQGATGVVHGRRMSYFCQHSTTVLLGEPNRSKRVWTIGTARPTHGGHFRLSGRKAIRTAYFGRPTLIG